MPFATWLRAAALALFALALPLAGQEHPNVARGLGGATVQAGDLDQVNLFNGNLVLAIPIGASYPVGGGLSYGLGLVLCRISRPALHLRHRIRQPPRPGHPG